MAQTQKHPLRILREQEERELQRLVKATSERQGAGVSSQSITRRSKRAVLY
jgi:hypothetical protein